MTIGASWTALYSVTLKAVKNEESYIAKGFLKGFKENFKQSTIAWLVILFVGTVLFVDIRFAMGLEGGFGKAFGVTIYAMSFVYLMIAMYIFPYIARFHATMKQIFKNALLIGYRQFSVHITSFWSQYFSTVCDVFQCTGNDHSTCILVHDWIFVSGICHIVYLPEDLFEI